jgi:predicted nucleic acid-binding protein
VKFWDSSTVIPLLIRQAASPTVDKWLEDDPVVVIWSLTPVEITSALWRLVREGALPERAALLAETRAEQLVSASQVVIDMEAVKPRARRLLRAHQLRAADALQLAAALVWAGDQPEGRTLYTLDERLAGAARREGFEVPG